MLPEASYETSRSDPVGLLQRISATQSDRTQYVLVVTDMADSFDRFSIAACSPGASSGSRATPAGWTASWRSCKSRGICPSCGGRRMADTAAHLVDHVIPDVPVRQWVLSPPHALRYRVAHDSQLLAVLIRIFIRTIFSSLRRRARVCVIRRGQ